MKTADGEFLSDVVSTDTGKIAGKARVKSNISKQVTAAGFQLISFAVAQSHLSDINSHLKKIEGLCEDLKKDNENLILSELGGDIRYLSKVIDKIEQFSSVEVISEIQKNQIESVIRDFDKYQERFIIDFDSLISSINSQKDNDMFGTESTYKELSDKQKRYNDLLLRVELIARIYILLRVVRGYVDPYSKDFSLVETNPFFEEVLEKHNKYKNAILDKSKELLKSSFNAQDTLTLRRNNIELETKIQDSLFHRINDNRIDVLSRLDNHLSQLTYSNKVRYALKFDAQGQIEEASLV